MSVTEISDTQLLIGMFDKDRAIADMAKRIYMQRHANDPQLPEPKHCDECFEGCPKCQP